MIKVFTSPLSSATRSATVMAEILRGCVTTILPIDPSPLSIMSSRMYWGTWRYYGKQKLIWIHLTSMTKLKSIFLLFLVYSFGEQLTKLSTFNLATEITKWWFFKAYGSLHIISCLKLQLELVLFDAWMFFNQKFVT